MMDNFLESLSRKQLNELQDILNNYIDGDIDFFIFNIKQELDKRDIPILNLNNEIN